MLPNSVTSQRREKPVIFHYGSTAGSPPVGPLPVFVFYHGGGYVIGDLDTHDYVCRKIANVARCCVIAVDYRLAPSTNSPPPSKTPPQACAGSCRKHKTFRSTRRVSWSAAIAPAAIYRLHGASFARWRSTSVVFQMLLYPGTDMSMLQPSYQRDFTRFPLSMEAIESSWATIFAMGTTTPTAGRPAPGDELQATRPCLRIDCGLRPARRRRNGLCPQAGGQ